MKLASEDHHSISDRKAFFQASNSSYSYLSEEPLRAELFSSDQMKHLGKTLAKSHKLSARSSKDHLLKRLSDNENVLHEVRKQLTDSIKKNYQITPAGEWIVDNFYLIEEHIRNANTHFPKGYSEDLPQLSGSFAGLTRIYDIIIQIISHCDGRIDIENLSSFLNAYQTVTNLKLGELWAIPIMLRLALIENLRLVATRVAIDRLDENLADYWAKQIIQTAEKDTKSLILVIADMARSNPPVVSAFVSELIRQLRGKGPDLALALNWIEQQLSEKGLTSTELVSAETQKQAADQVSISNSITSLRLLNSTDWRDFVEAHSIVEQILLEDSGGIYGLMDFYTRDRYRHVIEGIAKKSKTSEEEVARIAIKLAQEVAAENNANNEDKRKSHVGYYLIDQGLNKTKKLVGGCQLVPQKIRIVLKRKRLLVYLSCIFLITLAVSRSIFLSAQSDTNHFWLLFFIAVLSLLFASQLAIAIVNFFFTLFIKPELLPRMDFSKGVPIDFSTLIVVPVMLVNEKEIEDLVDSLEVRFLANRNDNLYFGLLTDFVDASSETLPKDQILVDFAIKKINDLNRKYKREKEDLFFLFHRPRFWNPRENIWMGYERKRGKLSELNSLLRGGARNRFSQIVGNQNIFPCIRYVITLDADTQLPLGSAWKLIATMAHPLNHAWYDKKRRRVTKGYGILQPRVAACLPELTSSWYLRMHENEPGIDPYTKASSDVYQDLFGEGSFIGKGIYDLDMFKKVLEGRFAENTILSHDLLEGCYVRSGLVSDVLLFEKYPGSYREDMKRNIRWVRGDWQIFSWFLPFVKGPEGRWHKNPISNLSRWKIFDNIRRSLFPIALTLMLLLGWIALDSSVFWTIVVSCIIVIPIIIILIWNTIKKPKDVILKHHVRNSIQNIADISIKTIFKMICLPYEAFSNLKAITFTLWRMTITKRKLLEWDISSSETSYNQTTLWASYISMWVEPSLAIIVFAVTWLYFPEKLFITGPILVLWFITPFITWWLSKPLKKLVSALRPEQTIFLRKGARKIWSFFEHFIVEEDNWLPPDNFQEQPVVQIAHRTSITNIGLYLLSNLSASDFGYISPEQFIERTSKTLNTLEKMERFKGHFYNWYNTKSLEPLMPKYISTVDSGNLVGHLLVLKHGIRAITHQKNFIKKLFNGLLDTLYVFVDMLDKKDQVLLQEFKSNLESACRMDIINTMDLKSSIELLNKNFEAINGQLNYSTNSIANQWKQLLYQQVQQLKKEFKIFDPWIFLAKAPGKFQSLPFPKANATLMELLKIAREQQAEIDRYMAEGNTPAENGWLLSFQAALAETIRQAEDRITLAENLVQQCNEFADVEWDFLYDKSSKLLTIGYNAQEHHMDASFYDLLASEARLCVFIGIAQGKLPEDSWFALGRLLTNIGGKSILLSWSGSMFEYLMPLLIMPTYQNTLLDRTYKAAVEWQIEYGKQVGLPWGISESGFNMISANFIYQYRAFGAPGLGLKRGLEEDAVIAPYATMLALMVSPEEACENLKLFYEKGFEGQYGFYEAIDYTPSRRQRGKSNAIVYSFMAHHQGMSLLSLAYLLLDRPMQKLFESEPQFKAALLLLQERIPQASTFYTHTTEIADISYTEGNVETRIINTPNTPVPEVQLLSNGKYHVMITNAGGGYSHWKEIAVTRWGEDGTRDNWGTFCYIRDLESKTYWSNAHQPTLKKGDKYEVAFSQGRADFFLTNNDIETHTEIVVSPEDDMEIRRMSLINRSEIQRTIEVTSYAEVVLTLVDSDLMQPAFNKLFVQTEIVQSKRAIVCTRRARSSADRPPWMFHMMAMHEKNPEEISYETDRMEFIGRGNTTVNPQAMREGPLAGNEGSVLDPIVSIRYKITLDPDEKITIDMAIGISELKETCQHLVDKYQDKHNRDRVFEMAWTHSEVVLRQIDASEGDAQLYGQLANSILFVNPLFRPDPTILISNHRGQSGLWGYSISGDLPIVLLKIEKQTNMHLIKQLIQAHAYWRLKGLVVDLVIWNEEHSNYRQVFHNEIMSLIPAELIDRPGGVFLMASDQIPNEDRLLFQAVARINISDNGGTLTDHVKRRQLKKTLAPKIIASEEYVPSLTPITLPGNLLFFNGLGGFSADGYEYVILVGSKNKSPAPWVNVIANPIFGTVISESGSAYTWTENAHELRLTPWNNDPVTDSGGEAFYLRDEENGHFWSTSFLPAGGQTPYIVRHGFGYSAFEHIEDGIYSEMLVYLDTDAAIKFTVLKIHNQSGRQRRLSVTGYIEWVLGNTRTKTLMHIHTEVDPESGALFAKNSYNTEFSNRVAFFDVDNLNKTFTADRTEFIGRNGTLKNPDAMSRTKLSGKIGLALDPCAAIQVPFNLMDGEEHEIVFRLGVGKDSAEASSIAQQHRGSIVALNAFEKVKNYWKNAVASLQVNTPDAALNIITNGWLTYQTLSSRLWGRSGYYQSGGAFGFRDQLQDVLSLLHLSPKLARNQILLCASRQFKEGDVQHWWHPPTGRGIRTRCSDDFLWLPFVTSFYIFHTGDVEILDESAPFLEGRLLHVGEESSYDLPIQLAAPVKLYEHCVRAIKHGFNYGAHGLPLIGGGDWNDGFDKVGNDGEGESVWLAFFLYEILMHFIKIANDYKDVSFAEECKAQAQKLKENIHKHAWDGEWYKRAWFDDGTPLGSSVNKECVIDSIAQSWSVLSGAGDDQYTKIAMESAYNKLVQKEARIIQLLAPPFDKSDLNPGYIKGYVPGVRENGGQYTHAAIWMIIAFAKLGDNKRVWELLNMINPINHGKTPHNISTYKVEPYVLAADVYASEPHIGRGGWTWYTGSAGWLYRLITEYFLGLQQEGNKLKVIPCVPKEWESFRVDYRYKNSIYHIIVIQENNFGKMIITLDGVKQEQEYIQLTGDEREHTVEVKLCKQESI